MSVPLWLRILLGLIPVPAWMKLAIIAAYEIWKLLPWFHKQGALYELRQCVVKSKVLKTAGPVRDWTERWSVYCQKIGKYPG